MIDLQNLPKIPWRSENFQRVLYGLAPIVIGILILLVVMILHEI